MKKKSLVFSLIFFLLQNILFAQIGGQTIFQFLNFPASARIDAMGGTVNNIHDDDLNFGFQNPALYSEEMNNRVSLSPVFYLADSKYGFVGYSHSFRKNSLKKIGSFGAGIQYLNYGKFTGTDNWGYITDTFSANDLAFIVGGSRQYNEKLSYGVNLKFITSRYNIYTANALAADIGGAYYDFRKEICIGFSLKNFGYEFNQFSSHNHEKLPFNIQAGISKKLKHTPFYFL